LLRLQLQSSDLSLHRLSRLTTAIEAPGNAEDPWREVLSAIRTSLSPHEFETWFAPARFVGTENDVVVIRVPNAMFANHLEGEYRDRILSAFAAAGSPVASIRCSVAASPAAARGRTAFPAEGAHATPGIAGGLAAEDDVPTGTPGAGSSESARPILRSDSVSASFSFDSFVVGASNRFAFDLLREASRPGNNLFLSPLSASMALGMTMNGAGGETWNQMRDALGFGGLTEEEINAGYASLIEVLTELDPAVETAIGNSVWTRQGFPVRAEFVGMLREFFGAEATELDFGSPSASGRINEWVRSATGGHIEEIVPDPIPPGVLMALINAIYFKAPWTFEFDPDDTRTEPFYPEDRSPRTVPLMTIQRDFPYLETSRLQAVDLPYRRGSSVFAPSGIFSLGTKSNASHSGSFSASRAATSSELSSSRRGVR